MLPRFTDVKYLIKLLQRVRVIGRGAVWDILAAGPGILSRVHIGRRSQGRESP